MTYRKKLIEVILPLEEINEQSARQLLAREKLAREKSIRHDDPRTCSARTGFRRDECEL